MQPRKRQRRKKKKPDLLPVGTLIRNKWTSSRKIGSGGFGEIYAGRNIHTGEEVAIKVESADAPPNRCVLKYEVIALKKLQTSECCVRYISSGRQDRLNFLVLERLGSDLARMQRHCAKKKRKKRRRKNHVVLGGADEGPIFSLSTTVRLGCQMMDCLESIHEMGFIHRDIKPSNFCLGRPGTPAGSQCVLIDFSLARRWLLPTGELRPLRKTGFRGTARYASINSHKHLELSRRDDLWSVFYLLVEFVKGTLPWKGLRDKNEIKELKLSRTSTLVQGLPPQFAQFLDHCQSLEFGDRPNYQFLRQVLLGMLPVHHQRGSIDSIPFDWEAPAITATTSTTRRSSSATGASGSAAAAGAGGGNGHGNGMNSNTSQSWQREDSFVSEAKEHTDNIDVPDFVDISIPNPGILGGFAPSASGRIGVGGASSSASASASSSLSSPPLKNLSSGRRKRGRRRGQKRGRGRGRRAVVVSREEEEQQEEKPTRGLQSSASFRIRRPVQRRRRGHFLSDSNSGSNSNSPTSTTARDQQRRRKRSFRNSRGDIDDDDEQQGQRAHRLQRRQTVAGDMRRRKKNEVVGRRVTKKGKNQNQRQRQRSLRESSSSSSSSSRRSPRVTAGGSSGGGAARARGGGARARQPKKQSQESDDDDEKGCLVM